MNNFEYLLSPIDIIKGVGKKTIILLNKKKYLLFSIYYGNYHYPKLKLLKILKLMTLKLEKTTILKSHL